MVADGWRVAVHLRTSGTQLGSWGPLPPTGKRLEFEEMITVRVRLRSGRVVHQRGIVDNLNGLRQAGVMPTPRPATTPFPDRARDCRTMPRAGARTLESAVAAAMNRSSSAGMSGPAG